MLISMQSLAIYRLQVGNAFYIIQDGSVKVVDIGSGSSGSHFTDQFLQAGDYFGEVTA